MKTHTPHNRKKRVLVICSYESMIRLNKEGYHNITLLYDNPRKSIREIAKKYGNGKIISSDELGSYSNEFDIIIGMPGVLGNFATKKNQEMDFMSEVMNAAKADGFCATFIPASWLEDSHSESWKIINQYTTQQLKLDVTNNFPTAPCKVSQVILIKRKTLAFA